MLPAKERIMHNETIISTEVLSCVLASCCNESFQKLV